LRLSPSDARQLTDAVMKKTCGNPLFVVQLLRSLSDKQFLYFCYQDCKWKWDIDKIEAMDVTDNVMELILEKMLKMNKSAQNALKMASCLGNSFSLSMLIIISVDAHAIHKAISNGFISPVIKHSTEYHFVHDQVRRAAYTMIPENDREATHLHIGKSLWKHYKAGSIDIKLLDVVNHINLGLDFVSDQQERLDIARLNLQAGKEAKSSAAFKSSAYYLMTGINLLNDNRWQEQYVLSLQLYNSAADAYFCLMDFPCMEKIIAAVLKNVASLVDKIHCYSLRVRALSSRGKYHEAIEAATIILNELGEKICIQPTEETSLEELHKTKAALQGISHVKILALDNMKDEVATAAMTILSDMVTSCFVTKSKLLVVVVTRMIQLTLQHGVSKHSCCAFAFYGSLLLHELDEVEEGYDFGQLALSLAERFKAKELLPQLNLYVYAHLNHWCKPIQLSLEPLLHYAWVGLELGTNDISWALFNAHFIYSFLSGKPLMELEEKMRKIHCHKSESFLSMYQTILNFLGIGSANPAFLIQEEYNPDNQNISHADSWASSVFRMALAYYFQEYEFAAEVADECRSKMHDAVGLYIFPHQLFYEGLTSMSILQNSSDSSRLTAVAIDNLARLKKWSKHSPENFMNKICLLEAEIMVHRGRWPQAALLYDRSILLATQNDFVHEEALACERKGIFYLNSKDNLRASDALARAYLAYARWGAKEKMRHLLALYPEILSGVAQENVFDLDIENRSSSSVSGVTELF